MGFFGWFGEKTKKPNNSYPINVNAYLRDIVDCVSSFRKLVDESQYAHAKEVAKRVIKMCVELAKVKYKPNDAIYLKSRLERLVIILTALEFYTKKRNLKERDKELPGCYGKLREIDRNRSLLALQAA